MGIRLTNRNRKKVLKVNEDNYALALYMDRSIQARYEFMLPRCYTSFDNECDVFGIRKSGYCDEFEIKTSRGDFFADSKKVLHEIEYVNEEYQFKHGAGRILKSTSYALGSHITNYFWYVVPTDMIAVEDVPEWTGLIYITETGHVRPIKSPKLLHKRKVSADFKYKMARKATFRIWKNKTLDFEENK